MGVNFSSPTAGLRISIGLLKFVDELLLVVGLNLRICGTRQTFCFRAWPQTKFAKSFVFFFSLKSFAFQTVVFWDDPWKALKEFGGIHDHYDACENEKLQKTSTSILNFDWKICLCFFFVESITSRVSGKLFFNTFHIHLSYLIYTSYSWSFFIPTTWEAFQCVWKRFWMQNKVLIFRGLKSQEVAHIVAETEIS